MSHRRQVAADLRAAVPSRETPPCPCPEVTGPLFSSSCVDGPAVGKVVQDEWQRAGNDNGLEQGGTGGTYFRRMKVGTS